MTRLSPAKRERMRTEHAYVPPMSSTQPTRCRKGHLWPCDVVLALDHLDDVDPAESTVEIGGVRMTQSQFDAARRPLLDTIAASPSPKLGPRLGMASTRELLDEITARIAVDQVCGGGGLDYRTVDEPSPPATAAVHEWRAVGPDDPLVPLCGELHRSDGDRFPPTRCVLREGHEGAHADGFVTWSKIENDPEPEPDYDFTSAIQDWVERNLGPLWTVRAHIMRATGEATEWVIPETVARNLKIAPGATYRGDPIIIEDRVEAIVRVRR